MKTKLLTLLTVVLTVLNTYSQPNTTDYVSGLVNPNGILVVGTDLYIQGFENIYKIDTTTPIPVANSIHTPEADFFMTNMVISGNLLYMAQENYIISTDTWLGSRIVSLDLNNLAAPVEVIYSILEYISALTVDENTIYFSSETLVNPPAFEPFFTHIDKIDISQANPTAVNIVPNISENNVVRDLVLHNNNLLISVDGEQKVFSIDITQSNPTIETVVSGLNFNRGIFKNGNELYISDGFQTKKIELDNPSASLITVAQNTTYEDSNNGTPYYANFRDVALIGNRMYMSLQSQGRVVSTIDTTLSSDEFAVSQFSLYPNPTSSKFQIALNSSLQLKSVSLLNSLGQEVFKTTREVVDVSGFSTGVYYLKIKTDKGIGIKKVVVK